MKKIACGVLSFAFAFPSFAEVPPLTKLRDLSFSRSAGFLGADAIEMQKDIFVPGYDPRFDEKPPAIPVGQCLLNVLYAADSSPHVYNKGHRYRIAYIRKTNRHLKIKGTHFYHKPDSISVYCGKLTGDSTVADFEKATGGALRIR
jgi:hypothetical protein